MLAQQLQRLLALLRRQAAPDFISGEREADGAGATGETRTGHPGSKAVSRRGRVFDGARRPRGRRAPRCRARRRCRRCFRCLPAVAGHLRCPRPEEPPPSTSKQSAWSFGRSRLRSGSRGNRRRSGRGYRRRDGRRDSRSRDCGDRAGGVGTGAATCTFGGATRRGATSAALDGVPRRLDPWGGQRHEELRDLGIREGGQRLRVGRLGVAHDPGQCQGGAYGTGQQHHRKATANDRAHGNPPSRRQRSTKGLRQFVAEA